jgi:branched-chain amino acid transport system substrate-binding protein
VLGTAAAVTAACGHGGSAATGSRPAGPDLVFGACLELTGAGSVVGLAERNALQVALNTLNPNGVEVGGSIRRVRLIVRDNASDPAIATAQTRQLIDGDQVSGLIGGGIAATAIAMAGVAEPREVPLLTSTAADSVVQPIASRRFTFKLGPDAADVATIIGAKLHSQRSIRVGLLAEASDHGDFGVAAMTTVAHTNGLKLTHPERLPIGVSGYQNEAARVRASSPDAVVIWAVSPAAGLAARALRGAGFTGPMLFDSGAASDDSLTTANRPAIQGSWVVSPRIIAGNPLGATSPAAVRQRDFFDQYTRLYGTFSTLGVYAADALNLLVAAAGLGNSSARLRIRNELESTPFEGLAGGYVFSTIQHGGVRPDSLGLYQLGRSGWGQRRLRTSAENVSQEHQLGRQLPLRPGVVGLRGDCDERVRPVRRRAGGAWSARTLPARSAPAWWTHGCVRHRRPPGCQMRPRARRGRPARCGTACRRSS